MRHIGYGKILDDSTVFKSDFDKGFVFFIRENINNYSLQDFIDCKEMLIKYASERKPSIIEVESIINIKLISFWKS